jgi:hypothetical protein
MTARRHGLWLALLVALALAPGAGVADSPQDRERVRQLVSLMGNSDFRVRVQACLSLGRVGGPGVRSPLERALRDEQPAVRAAAAASLARLGDRSALPALRRAQSDSAPVVRQQIETAIRALTRSNGELDWNAVRLAIGVGAMANRSQVRGDELRQIFRQYVLAELRASGNVAVVPDSPPADLVAQITRRRLNRYFVEGTVSRVTREFAQNGTVSVRAEISLMILSDPGRDLRMMLSGAAAAEQSRDTFTPAAERQMQDRALEGAVRGAFSRLIRTLTASL